MTVSQTCVYPNFHRCRWCEYSSDPDLFDGCCMIQNGISQPIEGILSAIKGMTRWQGYRKNLHAAAFGKTYPLNAKPKTFFAMLEKRARCAFQGLTFLPGNGYAMLRILHCVNPKTGSISSDAQQVIQMLQSYSEKYKDGIQIVMAYQGKLACCASSNDWLFSSDASTPFEMSFQPIQFKPIRDCTLQIEQLIKDWKAHADEGDRDVNFYTYRKE